MMENVERILFQAGCSPDTKPTVLKQHITLHENSNSHNVTQSSDGMTTSVFSSLRRDFGILGDDKCWAWETFIIATTRRPSREHRVNPYSALPSRRNQ